MKVADIQRGVDTLLVAHGAALLAATNLIVGSPESPHLRAAQVLLKLVGFGFLLAVLARLATARLVEADMRRKQLAWRDAFPLSGIFAAGVSCMILISCVAVLVIQLGAPTSTLLPAFLTGTVVPAGP